MSLSLAQVQALAGAAGLASARSSADPRKWSRLGHSPDAAWGDYQGSALYQTRVTLGDLAAQCTCPSRRVPCKHALGLLLLLVDERVPAAEPPDWVQSERRAPRPPSGPVDTEAQARRASKRADRVRAGLEALERWLNDLMRTGLATVAGRGPQTWHEQAARLVDAQAPGLARRLAHLADLPHAGPDFHLRLADGLGRLTLLARAATRLAELPPPLAADVRSAVGWTLERDEVLAAGDHVSDDWCVVGQRLSEDERLSVQRTWLRGQASGRAALVLQFSVGDAFPEALAPGTALAGRLAFWPSAYPQRAQVVERLGEVRAFSTRLAGLTDVAGLLDEQARALARLPWLDRLSIGLGDVVAAAVGGAPVLIDRAGLSLPLEGDGAWRLVGLGGGAELDVFGEWNGRAFLPLGAQQEGRYHQVSP